jgi:hypothetical protein
MVDNEIKPDGRQWRWPTDEEALELQKLRQLVLTELHGGLWHTTNPDRFKGILVNGAILPEPDIADSDRLATARGKDYYSYVRTLGGVSLFDFDQFDPESYANKCPMSTWTEFVPYRKCWGRSVWIEIDRELVAPKVISCPDLVARWKTDNAYRHSIMPRIEAAHLGPLPRTAFKRAFLVGEGDDRLHPLAY